MTDKDAYDIVISLSEVYSGIIKFFIAICTLFGGWVVANHVGSGGATSFDRIDILGLVVIFSASTVTLTMGACSMLKRINSALDIAKVKFKDANTEIGSEALPLFQRSDIWPTYSGMGLVILFVNILIVALLYSH